MSVTLAGAHQSTQMNEKSDLGISTIEVLFKREEMLAKRIGDVQKTIETAAKYSQCVCFDQMSRIVRNVRYSYSMYCWTVPAWIKESAR